MSDCFQDCPAGIPQARNITRSFPDKCLPLEQIRIWAPIFSPSKTKMHAAAWGHQHDAFRHWARSTGNCSWIGIPMESASADHRPRALRRDHLLDIPWRKPPGYGDHDPRCGSASPGRLFGGFAHTRCCKRCQTVRRRRECFQEPSCCQHIRPRSASGSSWGGRERAIVFLSPLTVAEHPKDRLFPGVKLELWQITHPWFPQHPEIVGCEVSQAHGMHDAVVCI